MISAKTKSLLVFFSISTLLFLGALVYGAYNIRAMTQEASALQHETDSRAEEEVAAQSIRMSESSHRTSLDTLQGLVLTSGNLVGLIETIEKAGKDLGLETSIPSVGNLADKDADKKNPQLINIQVDAAGTWASALTFVRKLESLPQRVIIDNLNLYKESTAKDAKWHVEVSLTFYSFPI